jgi:hypothetical protein
MSLLPGLKLDWRSGRGADLDVTERVGPLRAWKAIPLTGRTKTGKRRKPRKGASIRIF